MTDSRQKSTWDALIAVAIVIGFVLTALSILATVSSAHAASVPGFYARVGRDAVRDSDRDGLPDRLERAIGSNPHRRDSDHDHVRDGVEVLRLGTDPLNRDSDADGLDDGVETYQTGTDPTNSDTDADGLSDGREFNEGTDPTTADSDGDGLDDGEEIARGTDPGRADSDGDGLEDGTEVNEVGSDPLSPDSDADGVDDGEEIDRGTDPGHRDTDGDGIDDGTEIADGTDPTKGNVQDIEGSADIDSDGDGDAARDNLEAILPGANGAWAVVEYEERGSERHFVARTYRGVTGTRVDVVVGDTPVASLVLDRFGYAKVEFSTASHDGSSIPFPAGFPIPMAGDPVSVGDMTGILDAPAGGGQDPGDRGSDGNNSGDHNSGSTNPDGNSSGDHNSGSTNPDGDNSGDHDSGSTNTDGDNSGDHNSGSTNPDGDNSGDHDSGDRGNGDHGTTSRKVELKARMADGHGMRVEIGYERKSGKTQFEVEISGGQAAETLVVRANGLPVASITLDRHGNAKTTLTTRREHASDQLLPADFPTLRSGDRIAAGSLSSVLRLDD